jgi:hypothetical protein
MPLVTRFGDGAISTRIARTTRDAVFGSELGRDS